MHIGAGNLKSLHYHYEGLVFNDCNILVWKIERT